jgi:glucans biosynthesis protein
MGGLGHANASILHSDLKLGPAQYFSFKALVRRARELAASTYAAPAVPATDILRTIDFAVSQNIRFKAEYTLSPKEKFPIRFFFPSKYTGAPVRINVVDGNQFREIRYSPEYFDFGHTGLDRKLPSDIGFSGFRIMSDRGLETDWLAFQGASYFRASGAEDQYGISARGIAVDTALASREEFPRFTEFWLAPSRTGPMTIYALLDSPSLTGAYRFEASNDGGVLIGVHMELFTRTDIERLGVAPLTSMYWYGENNFRQRADWRPAIHDSDGLALWTGRNEHIWRPLVNPPTVQTNSFLDVNPKGFGLSQRDRNFDHYQDDSAFYNRRPGLWVEPLGAWGEGAVQLVEIPTDDEVNDNIVAFWQPHAAIQGGAALSYDYRLHWKSTEPFASASLARVVATRNGRGGIPGLSHPRDRRKFVIDFQGGPLDSMPARFDIQPVVSLSRGKAENGYVIKVVGTGYWRAFFDVDISGDAPLDMRCYLRLGDKTLTETWLYQFFPSQA